MYNYIIVKINVYVYICLYIYMYLNVNVIVYIYIHIITQQPRSSRSIQDLSKLTGTLTSPPTQTAQHLKKSKQSGFVTSCLGTALGAKIVVTFLSFLGCYIFPPTFPVPHHQYRLHRLRQWSNSPMVRAENSLVPRREIYIASTWHDNWGPEIWHTSIIEYFHHHNSSKSCHIPFLNLAW